MSQRGPSVRVLKGTKIGRQPYVHSARTRRPPARPSRAHAFSLIELVIVVMIIGTVSLIAIPRLANSRALYRVEMAARRVAADIRYASEEAAHTSAGARMQFGTLPSSYAIAGVADINGRQGDYAVNLSKEPYLAMIQSIDFGGDHEIIFDGYGEPDTGGSLVLRVGTQVRTVAYADGDVEITP